MRTTKYEWVCLARNATYGEYAPETSGIVGPGPGDTQLKTRQEQWVKAYIRPDKVGNEFAPKTDGSVVYWGENTFGVMYLTAVPTWTPAPPLADSKGKVYQPVYGSVSYVWWAVIRPTVTDADWQTDRNWIPVIGVSNTATGTRFNKHYECKVSNFNKNVSPINDTSPPNTEPTTVTTFEQAEARLRTVIHIGDGIIQDGQGA